MPKMSHIEITRLQGGLAVASFSCGVLIAMVCLFWIEPLGEITYSAISIVSELLVLCGAILGVKASYDDKFHKFEAELLKKADRHESSRHLTYEKLYTRSFLCLVCSLCDCPPGCTIREDHH